MALAGREMPMMTLVLVMVFQISVAMGIGFILGRIWQILCDLEQQRAGGFTAPPIDLVAIGRKADVRRTLSEVRVWPKADILIAWPNVRFRG